MNNSQLIKTIILSTAAAAAIGTVVLPTNYVWGAINTPIQKSVHNVSVSTKQVPATDVKIATKPINISTDTYTAAIKIPVIAGMKDTAYEKKWNEEINQQIIANLDKIRKQASIDKKEAHSDHTDFNPYRIEVSYTAACTDNIISLRVETFTLYSGMRGTREVKTYNVKNDAQASAVSLKSLFGSNYQKTINASIVKQIKHSKEHYFNGSFKGIAAAQPFYLKNGKVQVVFQPDTIAVGLAGVIEFTIPALR
ncbi:DUF3298 and DUF4163 domain-containing protein [Paenibacillus sp. Z6-24]